MYRTVCASLVVLMLLLLGCAKPQPAKVYVIRPIQKVPEAKAEEPKKEEVDEPFTQIWKSDDIGYVGGIVVADVDNDGTNEIVVSTTTGGSNGYIYIFDTMTHELEWKSSNINRVGALKIDDLNGDGRKEIIAKVTTTPTGTDQIGARYGYIYIFDGINHEQKWKSDNIGGRGGYLEVADLNGNGVKEIIADSAHYYSARIHGHVYVFDGGSFTQKWKSEDINQPGKITLGDVDDDGVKEIITGNMVNDATPNIYPGYIYVFSGADFSLEWKSPDIGISQSNIHDIDGDGKTELITSVLKYGAGHPSEASGGYIYVFDGKTYKQEWKSPNIYRPFVKVDDIDNDGTKEIIARTYMLGKNTGYIQVFDGKTYKQEWKSDDIGSSSAIEIDDIDNDGVKEILTGNRDSFFIFNGITHAKEWETKNIASGVFVDIDNDGWKELIARIVTQPYHGYLSIWEPNIPAPKPD